MTAYRAARVIQNAYRQYRGRKMQQAKSRAVGKKAGKHWGGVAYGTYVGKFKRGKRKVPKEAAVNTAYQSTGALESKEIYGKIDDPDCVYIGHSTFDVNQFGKVIAQAVVRKLLKKAGFNPDSPNQEIPFFSYNDSDGFQLSFTRTNADDTIANTDYVIPNDATLASIATNSGFEAAIVDAMYIDNGQFRGNFDRITLRSSDRNGVSTNWRLASEINFKTEVLKLFSRSRITIQNRTKSDSGSSSTDIIDNQPLKGYHYVMTGGVPKPKTMGPALNKATLEGIVLRRAAQLGTLYKEPPVPKEFANCYKSATASLNPGSIKSSVIVSSWTGYFNNLVSGKLVQRASFGSNAMLYAPGKCELFAFEECLNSGSANLITVSYEAEKTVGAKLISGKKPVMLAGFSEQVLNNLTA